MSRLAASAAASMLAAAAGNPWPGMSSDLAAAFGHVVNGGTLAGNSAYIERRHIIFHRETYAAAGATSFTFFDDTESEYYTNLPQGVLPNEQAFLAKFMRIAIERNITGATGAVVTAAATYIAAVTAATNSEEEQRILNAGKVKLTLAGREIVNVFGLCHFPSGGGAVVANGGTVAAQMNAAANNGVAHTDNGFRFPGPGLIIPPGKPLRGSVLFQTAMPLTGAGVIRVELEGILVTPANA